MDNQAFDLLTKMIQNHKDDSDKKFEYVMVKLDEVLKFRYQLLGGSIVISILAGAAFNLLIKYIVS